MADPQNSNDIRIPPPQSDSSPSPAAQPATVPPATSQAQLSLPINITPPGGGLSGNQIIMGVVISLGLAALFWFVGRILADTFVKQFAEVGAAKRAGVALFAFLTSLGISATFGFLGNFWSAPFFLIPAGSLVTLLFLVFIFCMVGASRSRRR